MAVGGGKDRVYFTLSSALVARVQAAADRFGVTKSAVVEAVLDRHLDGLVAVDRPRAGGGEGRDARTLRLQREGREAQARRDALIGAGR